MLRSVLAAIGAYIVMIVVVMVGIWVAWAVLGGAGAFRGEGPEPSTAWIAWNFVTGFLAALAAGWVARRIGKSSMAVKILVVLILVVGLYYAVTAESSYAAREPVDTPVAEMSFREAGLHARQPTWYNWVIPLVGVAGVLVGGRQRSPEQAG